MLVVQQNKKFSNEIFNLSFYFEINIIKSTCKYLYYSLSISNYKTIKNSYKLSFVLYYYSIQFWHSLNIHKIFKQYPKHFLKKKKTLIINFKKL